MKLNLNCMLEWLVFISVPLDLCLMPVLLELPVSVVKGADLPGLEPSGDAVEVEGVVAHPPGHCALLAGGAGLKHEMQ